MMDDSPFAPGFKGLPCSDIAERGVLCSILLHPVECCRLCSERGITEDHFYLPAHQTAFDHLMQMHRANRPIDVVTFTQWLLDRDIMAAAGGSAYVSELFTYLPTATNVAHFIDILCEKLTLRRIIDTCTKHAQLAYEEQEEPARALEAVEKAVMAIREKRAVQRGFTGKDIAVVGGEVLQHQYQNLGKISGLATGFHDLDLRTDGLHEGELIVLAARPGRGKSAAAMNIVEFLAIERGVPCGVLSLEMSQRQLAARLIASYARVNTARWRFGHQPSDTDIAWINWAQGKYAEAPMYFEELSDPTIQEVRGIGRRMKADHDIKLLVIDSLSVLRSSTHQGRENRAREVAECSNGVKEMAKELQIPIILIAHLGRGTEKGETQRQPNLSDLRESGGIEQDADSVWMLWEPEEGQTELYGPKNRNGEPNFRVRMNFEREYVRFTYQAAKQEQGELQV